MALLTRKQKKSQKSLVQQRDEAVRIAQVLTDENAQLKVGRDEVVKQHTDPLMDTIQTLTEQVGELERKLLLQASTFEEKRLDYQKWIAEGDVTIANQKATIESLQWAEKELSSLKVEDVKNLRKRLQAKTERVTELEAHVAALDPNLRTVRALGGIRPGVSRGTDNVGVKPSTVEVEATQAAPSES